MNKGRFLGLIGVLLVFFLLPAGAVLAYDSNPNIELLDSGSLSFNDWYAYDKGHAITVVSNNLSDKQQLKSAIYAEWQAIAAELANVQAGCYRDENAGYRIYTPEASGKIHVLTLAKAYREAVLDAVDSGKVSGIVYPSLLKPEKGFFPVEELAVATTDKYVGINQTIDTISSISLPISIFNDLTIYLMPYQVVRVNSGLGEVSGFHSGRLPGRDEVIYITALSKDEQGGFPPAAATITHEIGHYIHSILLGSYEKNKSRWQPFLDLGEQGSFVDNGSWANLTDENFAEYFRMTYGNKSATAYKYGSSYPAPIPSRMALFKEIIDVNLDKEEKAFWDYANLTVWAKDRNGKKISFKAGPRFGDVALVTDAPEVNFEGYIMPGSDSNTIPCIVFYPDGKLASTDEDFPPVEGNKVNCSWKFGAPGKYYMTVGSMDRSAPPPGYIGNEGMITVYYVGDGPATYKDIAGHWAKSSIEQMAVDGYMNGMGDEYFTPDRPVTRGEFAGMLARVLKLSGSSSMPFNDLQTTDWYYESIGYAFGAGLIKGISVNKFVPDDLISREQMAAMICNAIKYKGMDTDVEIAEVLASFDDSADISDWAAGFVAQVVKQGLMKGMYYDMAVKFEPKSQATRAEAVVVLKKLMDIIE